jgi:hypothetical protein
MHGVINKTYMEKFKPYLRRKCVHNCKCQSYTNNIKVSTNEK